MVLPYSFGSLSYIFVRLRLVFVTEKRKMAFSRKFLKTLLHFGELWSIIEDGSIIAAGRKAHNHPAALYE